MNPEQLFKKLNYKDQSKAIILFAPENIKSFLTKSDFGNLIKPKFNADSEWSFLLCFAQNRKELENHIETILPSINGDVVLWFAYPKKSSKNYYSDINRDNGWEALGKYNFEPVRQVSIDDDWSALRFRHISYIKQLKRNPKMLLSVKNQKAN
ncbi:hypothetical protein HZR84_00375 [Hyphobacterium sp. CCMP332]|nr:hypothetical protein HZR84_00375 [Hyphobacterium sp. CCMP332]